MADFSAVTPLLDGFTVGECVSSRDGISCYRLRHDASGQRLILKHISIPESEAKLQALLLSGAYANAEEANGYFKLVADNYANEFALSRSFADCPFILHYLAHQVVEKKAGPGYDVYAVCDEAMSLCQFWENNAMTKLRAVNLGIDLCAALCAIRAAGYLHQDLKPENIFVENDRFLLGDLGLTAIQDMKYSSLPEQYIGPYTAPELHDIMAGQNATTDLYAVGMLLYRIYNAAHAPFEDETVTAKEADRMRMSGKQLPAPMYADYELAEILLKACAFKPENRYQSPEELKQALELYMQRNGIADTLIVPPIVSDSEPAFSDAEPELMEEDTDAPIRFADVTTLDEDFIRHFTPDKEGLDAAITQMKQEDAKQAAHAKQNKAQKPETETPDAEEPVCKDTEELPAEAPETAPAQDDLTEHTPTERSADEGLTMIEVDGTSAAEVGHSQSANRAEKKGEKAGKKHRARGVILGLLALLLVAAVFVYFFTPLGQKIYHYTINIEQFEVQDTTADSLRVHLRANVAQPPIEVSCKDSYGNHFDAPLVDGTAVFEGLEGGTQYTVTAALRQDAGLHRLTGTTTVTATTLPSTEILVLNASAGSEEGAVVLDLVVKDGDPQPEEWTVSYSSEDGEHGERSFPGESRSFTVSGLAAEKEYTFTIVSTGRFRMTGVTSTVYTTEKAVTAQSLSMESFTDGVLRVRWECTSEPPAQWTVTCTDPEGKEYTAETGECAAAFEGLQVGTAYTVTLRARGLFIPLSLNIPDTLVHIDSLSATKTENGVQVKWNATGGSSWILVCTAAGDTAAATAHNADTNTITLTELLPNTAYTLELKCADEHTAVGHTTTEYVSAKPEDFDSRGITVRNTVLTTYAVPDKDDWQMKDLETAKDTFDAADKIAYKLNSRTGRYKGSFSLLYIIRDENGVPVDHGTQQYVWNEVWSWDSGSNYGMAGSVDAPDRNGTFTLELYFSYDLEGYIQYKYVMTSAPFTVTGATEE